MSDRIKIAPSILSADFANLGQEIKDIDKAGADYIHVDVMDGHFVPNLTIGPCVVNSIRKYSELTFDVHLMIENPQDYIEAFAKAGSDIITIHYEACDDIESVLEQIRNYGKKAGVSLRPGTPMEVLDKHFGLIDLILVMTVNPGFGGQSFMHSQLKKIDYFAKKLKSLNLQDKIDLEVDGGINKDTAKLVIDAGANVLVAGSAVFTGDKKDYQNNIDSLRSA